MDSHEYKETEVWLRQAVAEHIERIPNPPESLLPSILARIDAVLQTPANETSSRNFSPVNKLKRWKNLTPSFSHHWSVLVLSIALVILAVAFLLAQLHTVVPIHTTQQTTEVPQPSRPIALAKVDTAGPSHKADSTATGSTSDSLQASDFRVSKFNYDSHLNLDSVIRYDPNLGKGWEMADWNDLKAFCTTPGKVDTLIHALGMPLVVDLHGVPDGSVDTVADSLHHFYVRWNGKGYWLKDTTGSHFFVTRWDHHPPSWWTVRGEIDNKHIVLGEWTGIHFRILAVRRKAIHEFSLYQHKKQ